MAAPADTTRSTPVGLMLEDGFSSKIAFARDPDISLWEKSMKPPGAEGGDAIEQTTMHNLSYRTMAARALITLTESTCKCAYDPQVYSQIIQLINQAGAITQHYPDGSKLSYYGFLKTFEPDELQEGVQPEASFTITPTNRDPDTLEEAGPVVTSVAGT
jgi:hypothetical protein